MKQIFKILTKKCVNAKECLQEPNGPLEPTSEPRFTTVKCPHKQLIWYGIYFKNIIYSNIWEYLNVNEQQYYLVFRCTDVRMEVEVEEETENGHSVDDKCPLHPQWKRTALVDRLRSVWHARNELNLRTAKTKMIPWGQMLKTRVELEHQSRVVHYTTVLFFAATTAKKYIIFLFLIKLAS